MNCPCNPNVKYEACCKPAHDNISNVTSAEQLMRSRYSAFVFANGTYLYESHSSKTRPSKREHKSIEKWAENVTWIKLEILKKTKSTVHFKAFYLEDGKMQVIEEHSKFVIENENWVYLGMV